jgi:hypothetical protein
MKIVVFGPFKRTGALHGESVVDLSRAYAKHLQERTVEPNPLEMADVVVPSNLVRLIEGGPRALDAAQQALDYLFGEAQDNLGPRGERSRFADPNGNLAWAKVDHPEAGSDASRTGGTYSQADAGSPRILKGS